uniref:ArnR1-like winged helix-turn-helix domain-containing protein n=1 Tax=Caldimicrobium thiodismutans TaxID=1653476 RepID=A0A832GMI2_9BACT
MGTGCVSLEGKLSERALSFLKLVKERGKVNPEEVVRLTGRPLFQVRSSLRELTQAGFLQVEGQEYSLTEKGLVALKEAM